MTVLDALQATLGDEHAALYTYGVLGARTSQSASPALYDALTSGHRRHRARATSCSSWCARPAAMRSPRRRRTTSTGGCCARRRSRCRGGPRGGQRRGAARAGRAVLGNRAGVGAHRGDLVGGLAAAARWRPQTGREPPSSTGLTASESTRAPVPRNRERPAASAIGKVPRSFPMAEDADRFMGLVSITLCRPSCGGGGTTCTIMHSIRPSG